MTYFHFSRKQSCTKVIIIEITDGCDSGGAVSGRPGPSRGYFQCPFLSAVQNLKMHGLYSYLRSLAVLLL